MDRPKKSEKESLAELRDLKAGVLLLSVGYGFALYLAVTSSIEASNYRRAYESTRSEAEAFRRTVGAGVDPSFVCKPKRQLALEAE